MRRAENRHFLSQKNLAMARILSEIDTPEEEDLSSSPTPPLLNYPHPHPHPPDSLTNLIAKAQDVVRSASLKALKSASSKAQGECSHGKEEGAFLTGVVVR